MTTKVWPHDSAHRDNDASNSASVGAPSHPAGRDAHSLPSSTSTDTDKRVPGEADGANVVGVSPDTAWAFTRRFSPRAAVRVQGRDGNYGRTATVYGPEPKTPWSIHLTDSDHYFRRLAFDFDAHSDDPDELARLQAQAAHDTTRFTDMLHALGIEHVVCESGPSGGRHVWISLADRLPGPLVSDLVVSAAAVFPSLDTAPLSNVVTGGVRPPGAPHAAGGRSTVLVGDVDRLCVPSTTRDQIEALFSQLVDLVPPAPPARATRVLPIAADEDGAPWIPGTWRTLSTYGWDRANTPLEPGADASARLFSVLLSAARAHWRLDDVAAQLLDSPGLEHVRTLRRPHGGRAPRRDRGSASPMATLAKNWTKAVEFLADNAHTDHELTSADPDFEERASEITAAIAHLQQKADACWARWARRGGAKQRLVLDALCVLSLTAVRLDVGAAVRTLAKTTGISRDSALRALYSLEDDGWITLHTPAHDTHAHIWQLLPYGRTEHGDVATAADLPGESEPHHVIHNPDPTRCDTRGHTPEAEPPSPGNTPPALARERSLRDLTARLELAAHDAFQSRVDGGLGSACALVYSRLPSTPQPLGTVFPTSTLTEELYEHLDDLYGAGLLTIDDRGHVARTDPAARDSYAAHACLAGILEARHAQYDIESAAWAWWVDESKWTTAADRAERRRHYRTARPRPGQHLLDVGTTPTWADRAPYPRRPGGRRDHRAARARIAAERSLER